MTREDVTRRVQKCAAESLGINDETATPDKTLEELGADSLDRVEFRMCLAVSTAVRPMIDYAPPLSVALRRARLIRIRAAAIDLLLAVAVIVFVFGAHRIVRAVDEYAITAERNAALEAEVSELRARVVEAEAWDCRNFGRTYDGRTHRWCTREVQP